MKLDLSQYPFLMSEFNLEQQLELNRIFALRDPWEREKWMNSLVDYFIEKHNVELDQDPIVSKLRILSVRSAVFAGEIFCRHERSQAVGRVGTLSSLDSAKDMVCKTLVPGAHFADDFHDVRLGGNSGAGGSPTMAPGWIGYGWFSHQRDRLCGLQRDHL